MGVIAPPSRKKLLYLKEYRNTKMKFPIYFYRILTFGQLQKNVITCPFQRVAKIIQNESFFCYLGFLSRTFTIHMAAGKGGGYLTPLYHFQPLHRCFGICRAITAESSNLLFSERKSLTTKLRALQTDHSKVTFAESGCYVQ